LRVLESEGDDLELIIEFFIFIEAMELPHILIEPGQHESDDVVFIRNEYESAIINILRSLHGYRWSKSKSVSICQIHWLNLKDIKNPLNE
jgi:hypothetical protein